MITVVALLLGVTGVAGSYYYARWKYGKIANLACNFCHATLPGQPFNILSVGSDSRQGLTGILAEQTGGQGSVSGQRSDVVKIIHVDPQKGSITVLSIPRDTLVSLLANQSTLSNFNRINVNYQAGNPSLLARTITANFGIQINHTITVSFGGLANTVNALGGVYMNFPTPARDTMSGVHITHPGCQFISPFQALAVARSRHYYYYEGGRWYYDGTSDYGRIKRQDAFLRALINVAKSNYNPITLNSLLSSLPEGIAIDSGLTFNDMIGLAVKFHNFNPANMKTYMLPVVSAGYVAPYGDVLITQQPQAQTLLQQIFGSTLQRPTSPPPNAKLQQIMPPVVTLTTTPGSKTTTTLPPPPPAPSFDPTPCTAAEAAAAAKG